MRIDVVAAIIRKDGKILITRRGPNVHLAGFWEFPGGKVETGESLPTALEREIREEVGLEICVIDEFLTVDYDYPTKSVRLHFFNCKLLAGEAQPLDVAELQWVNPKDLANYPFPPADTKLLANLQSASPL